MELARQTTRIESSVSESRSAEQRLDAFTKVLLHQRYLAARNSAFLQPKDPEKWPTATAIQRPIDAVYSEMERTTPEAFRHWRQLLSVNSEAYVGFPLHSCSVVGHPAGQYFQYFVYPYLDGRVLDIGCGPQPVPVYLQDYPLPLIYGIDPISDASGHPFVFETGIAEDLPWPDCTFKVVIAATSLDHVLLPDRAFSEVSRVLAKGGLFLVWVAFIENAPPYEPTNPDIRPVDQFHLFHFSKQSFENSVSKFFVIDHVCRLTVDIEHYFYALRPRGTS